MLRLRMFLVRAFMLIAAVYSLVAILVSGSILREFGFLSSSLPANGVHPHLPVSTRLLLLLVSLLVAAAPVLICVSSGVSAWRFYCLKPGGRSWAIACGFASVAVSLLGFTAATAAGGVQRAVFDPVAINFILVHLTVGLVILAAFLPGNSECKPLFGNVQRVKIKGDGTTAYSVPLAFALGCVVFYYADSFLNRLVTRDGLRFQERGFLGGQMLFLAVLFLAMLVHEAGHATAGFAMGRKLFAFQVGPLIGRIEDGKWCLKKPSSLKDLAAGTVALLPARAAAYSGPEDICIAASGPLANLLSMGVAYCLLMGAKGSFYEPVSDLLTMFLGVSASLFAANVLPFQSAAIYSDGARIWQIVKGSPLAGFRHVVSTIMAARVTPIRPRDFDIGLVQRLLAEEIAELNPVLLHLTAMEYHFDRSELEEAARELEMAKAAFPVAKRKTRELCHCIVVHDICLSLNCASARQWWQTGRTTQRGNPHGTEDLAALCSLAIAEGRMEEAEELWSQQLERIRRMPDTGERAYDSHCLERLHRRMTEAATLWTEAGGLEAGLSIQP